MPNFENNELSGRELDILRLVATGASNKEIAQKLFISTNTVKVHLRNIFTKIGVTSRTEAAMYAVNTGLVETVLPQLFMQDEELIDIADSEGPNAKISKPFKEYSLSDIKNNKQFVIYIGLFGLIIVLIFLGIVYIRRNPIHLSTAIPPTSTPRVQWFELPGLPTPRRGLAVANYENQIYAIGGETSDGISNFVERYDPQTSTWIDLSPKPTSVMDINAAVIGGQIYVPGGRLSSGNPTNITEIYDPQTDHWSSGIPLPKSLSAYALTVYEGRIYIFGGWDGKQIVNDSYVYDSYSKSWSMLPSMPTARSYAGAVTVGGKIYVIGGWNGSQALFINEEFLPDLSGGNPQWIQAINLPSGRSAMGITNLADIIFVIGGIGSDDDLTTIALVPGYTNWGQVESPIPKNLSSLGSVTVGSRLYALGGEIESSLNNQMWSYQAIFTITLPIIR
jgi:DNA-binding CsgD family transcriptional regulator